MKKAVFYCSYKLKKDISINDYLEASKKLNDGFISKQKGYISWQQLNDGNTWADYISFETMEDVKNFETSSPNAGKLADDFYSFINLNSCKLNYFSIESDF